MSESQSLVDKARMCIEAVKEADNLIQSQAEGGNNAVEDALNHLTSLQEEGKKIKEMAEETDREFLNNEKNLLEEATKINEERRKHETTLTSLSRKKKAVQCKLAMKQRSLDDSTKKLHSAERRLANAKSELLRAKTARDMAAVVSGAEAIATSIIGYGIGALVRAFIPSDGSGLVERNEDRVRKAESSIKIKADDITRVTKKVTLASNCMDNVQEEIMASKEVATELSKKEGSVIVEICVTKRAVAFQREVVDFWGEFVQACSPTASATVAERSSHLRQILRKADEARKMEITRSNGSFTVAKTFLEAWEEVSVKDGKLIT